MLCHVGHPELIRGLSVEVTLDPIFCSCDPSHPTKLWSARDALTTRSPHEQLHSLMSDSDALAQRQLCMNSTNAVPAPREDVNLMNQVGEPGVADRPCGHRSRPPGAGARLPHIQCPAGRPPRKPLWCRAH